VPPVSAGELAEPVLEAAPIALRLAPRLCTRAPGSSESCAWYHSLYPLLRVLDLAATPERQADFYLGVFRTLARDGGYGRVAITGTADQCLLAHLLWAFRQEGVEPRIDVIDRCATPLHLCQWYGDRVLAEVRTQVCDVLRWQPEERFDLVTTHAFIGMFPHARQRELVAVWRRALRPGGKLVTVARIDPAWSPDCPGFSASQAEAFGTLVQRRARERQAMLCEDAVALAARARAYAARMRSFPFASAGALAALLADGGFTLDRLDLVQLSGNAGAGQSGPGTHRPGTFAHFVAGARG